MSPSPTTTASMPCTMPPYEETPGMWLHSSFVLDGQVVSCVMKGHRLSQWVEPGVHEAVATNLGVLTQLEVLAKI